MGYSAQHAKDGIEVLELCEAAVAKEMFDVRPPRCPMTSVLLTILGPDPETRSHQIAELLPDEWCSQAVLVFLATTGVGRTTGPVAEEGDGAASEASEWENSEREEQLALLREEEEKLSTED